MGTLTALRPGESWSCWIFSADKRSSEEILTTTSAEGILGGDGAASHTFSCATSSASSSFRRSGFLFCAASASLLSTEVFSSSGTSGFVSFFLRVVRFGCAVVLALELDPSETGSSAIKFRDLTGEPRRLLRLPFENLCGEKKKNKSFRTKRNPNK